MGTRVKVQLFLKMLVGSVTRRRMIVVVRMLWDETSLAVVPGVF